MFHTVFTYCSIWFDQCSFVLSSKLSKHIIANEHAMVSPQPPTITPHVAIRDDVMLVSILCCNNLIVEVFIVCNQPHGIAQTLVPAHAGWI